jgi:hypothetical protein
VRPNKLNNALFSLFHHDVLDNLNQEHHFTDQLWHNLQMPISINEKELGDELLAIIKQHTVNVPATKIGLTLTGGFDSRVNLG